MKNVFLSASVPDPKRHPRYFTTADVISIRDSVRALATVVLPHAALWWGGHPAITPLIRLVAENMRISVHNRIRLFQSAWFSDELPQDNAVFESYQLTARRPTLNDSVAHMRDVIFSSAVFDAGIFIGGMEGVEEEFEQFRIRHPSAKVLPIASTGAAASIIYEREKHRLNLSDELLHEHAYPSLFRRQLDLPSSPAR